jgi:hypothetical protein
MGLAVFIQVFFAMKTNCLCIALLLLLGSCASLTKSQIEAVNQFSRTSDRFSAYPGRIITALADIRIRRGIYFSNSLDDPRLHLEELEALYDALKSDYQVSSKVNITFRVIDKYAQSLLLLSSGENLAELQAQSKNFGTGLDSLVSAYNAISGVKQVPTGIGGAVNKLIAAGGKQYIRSRQAKEIKQFVPAADTLIGVMTTNLLEFLQSTNIDELITNEEKGIGNNYLSFLRQRHATVENERDYLALKSDLDAVKKLRQKTVTATRRLRKAHEKLLSIILEKKTLQDTVAELQEFYEDVKEIRATMQTINSSKNQIAWTR